MSGEKRALLEGNHATAEGAIAGGCRFFFGYPITPQSQIPQYMSWRLEELGGVYLQAESEVAAINMVYGAAAAGARVMTTSSSPGISLMAEGISYLIGCELPCVIVNMVRGGPGLGNIAPSQGDYWLATRGGGHGDGRPLVFAPYSVQELYDMTGGAFEIAERYRNPVMILGDAVLATMVEACRVRPVPDAPRAYDHSWTLGSGLAGRERRIVNSLLSDPVDLEKLNLRLEARYAEAAERETRWEEYGADDPDILVCAYGVSARVCETAVDRALEQGIRVRMVRPISLYPFPSAPIAAWAEKVKHCLVVELSMGQFMEDVRLAVEGRCPVSLQNRLGGLLLTPEDVLERLTTIKV